METFIERVPEFVANHPFIFGALLLTVVLIGFMEYQRATRVGRPLSPMQATRLRNDEDAVVVDVRARKDYDKGHVHGALPIAEREIGQSIVQLQKKHGERPVILYDEGGFEAERAAKTLKQNGFERVYVIEGGMPAWRKAEMPIQAGGH